MNGVIADPGAGAPPKEEVTQDLKDEGSLPESNMNPDSQEKQSGIDWESENNPYKMRYSDSSRENSKNQQIIKENEQYAAIINVMKKT